MGGVLYLVPRVTRLEAFSVEGSSHGFHQGRSVILSLHEIRLQAFRIRWYDLNMNAGKSCQSPEIPSRRRSLSLKSTELPGRRYSLSHKSTELQGRRHSLSHKSTELPGRRHSLSLKSPELPGWRRSLSSPQSSQFGRVLYL